jgi:hypothetical protein
MAAVAALLVERQPNSRVPRRVVRSGCWVARASQTHARRPDERDREAGADEATYFAIRPLPFRQEARGELFRSCARLSASQSVHREHERSEGTAPSQAGVNVLFSSSSSSSSSSVIDGPSNLVFSRLAQPNRVLLVRSLAKLAGRTG